MQIEAKELGKKFINDWVFRKLSLQLDENQTYAVVGPNGSGKSTFLQIVAGMQPATEGKLVYTQNKKNIDAEFIFRHVIMAAPYLELIEEMTLTELVGFHLNFKKFIKPLSVSEFIEVIKLEKAKNKVVKYFSSGMKQRLKLGLAFYSDASLLLLDEPTSNLDYEGIAWYKEQIIQCIPNRLVLIASNQPSEFDFFCENLIKIK